MIRVLLWLLAGILTASFCSFESPAEAGMVLLVFFFLLYLFGVSNRSKLLSGLTALLFLWTIGVLLPELRDERLREDHIAHQEIQNATAMLAEVAEDTRINPTFSRTMVQILSIRNNIEWKTVTGKCLVYGSPENSFFKKQKVLILGPLDTIRPPWNPSDFNYKKWLEKQNVFFTHNLQTGKFISLDAKPIAQKTIIEWIDGYCKKIILEHFKNVKERSIVLAMVLGNTTEMTPELTDDFAATGTLHVLAVSGLHVSIICGILLLLLRPVSYLKKGKWIITGTSLVVLWLYAVLTGLSPSVLRAVTMYSFLTIAKPLGLRTNVFNTLASSAFILLIFDPWMIERPGFQLSFLAVTGIVWVYPRLVMAFEPLTKVGYYLWSTIAMTLSAQLLTLPLSLVLFGEFPLYFIPANLIIIPLSSLGLIIGIILMALDPIPLVGQALALGLSWLIQMMIGISEFFSDLPGSVLPAELSTMEGIFLFLLIVCLTLGVTRHQIRWIYGSLIFAVAGSAVSFNNHIVQAQKQNLCVFRIPGKSAAVFQNGFHSTGIYTDSGQLHQYFQRIKKKQKETLKVLNGDSSRAMIFKFGDQKIFYLNHGNFNLTNQHADVLILGKHAANIEFKKSSTHQIDTFILDSSLRGKSLQKLKEKLKKLGIEPYSVHESGAWCKKW